MLTRDMDKSMREKEYYHTLKVFNGAYTIIRVDGRGFSSVTEGFAKPFSFDFHDRMVHTGKRLLKELHGLYGHVHSDEISILLSKDNELFGRNVEKLASLSASIASSAMTMKLGMEVHFDSRVWIGITDDDVVDYFRWRQADAYRNCLYGYCYWNLRSLGLSGRKAARKLQGLGYSAQNELLMKEFKQNPNDLPVWERRGTDLGYTIFHKPAINGLTGEPVTAVRRMIQAVSELPFGEKYSEHLERYLGSFA